MRRSLTLIVGTVMLAGLAGIAEAGKPEASAALFSGKSASQAADALAEVAFMQAGGGSWEQIAVARVYYLGGHKDRAQEIFDAVLGDDPEASDWIRIGRIYYAAGDWDKAKDMFERVLAKKPKDADWLAEIGAYYNLQGDRARAEELFARSFAEEPKNERNTAFAAGSYIGVVPNP